MLFIWQSPSSTFGALVHWTLRTHTACSSRHRDIISPPAENAATRSYTHLQYGIQEGTCILHASVLAYLPVCGGRIVEPYNRRQSTDTPVFVRRSSTPWSVSVNHGDVPEDAMLSKFYWKASGKHGRERAEDLNTTRTRGQSPCEQSRGGIGPW